MTKENLKTIINLVFIQVISGWKRMLPGLLDRKTEDEEAAEEKKERGLSLDGDLIRGTCFSDLFLYLTLSVSLLQYSISPSLSSVGDMLRTSHQDELIHYFPINRLRMNWAPGKFVLRCLSTWTDANSVRYARWKLWNWLKGPWMTSSCHFVTSNRKLSKSLQNSRKQKKFFKVAMYQYVVLFMEL